MRVVSELFDLPTYFGIVKKKKCFGKIKCFSDLPVPTPIVHFQTLSESKVFHDIPGMKSTCVAHAHPARHQATETMASDSRTPVCTITFCT